MRELSRLLRDNRTTLETGHVYPENDCAAHDLRVLDDYLVTHVNAPELTAISLLGILAYE